jgi:hypothetical protein
MGLHIAGGGQGSRHGASGSQASGDIAILGKGTELQSLVMRVDIVKFLMGVVLIL